jgi:hypothetical protein
VTSAAEDFFGISRILGRCTPQNRPELAMFHQYELAQACRPQYAVSWLGEFDDFEKSADEAAQTTFGQLPVLIISQDYHRGRLSVPRPRQDSS